MFSKRFWLEKVLPYIETSFVTLLIVAGAFVYGIFYINENVAKVKKEGEENAQKVAQLEEKLTLLESLLYETKENTETIASILGGTLDENSALKSELSTISETVGVLEKLSFTDEELLQKYSKVYFLNEHYEPESLTKIGEEYLYEKDKEMYFQSDAWFFLESLLDEANKDGNLNLLLASAYRSFDYQEGLKNSYVVKYGEGTANTFSADQGYSEHQLGTAVDFTTTSLSGALNGFDKKDEYDWLLENAHKYGFVISYPEGNSYYKYEPWHWRFVGVKLATYLHENNMYFYDMDQREIDKYLPNLFDR